jgi:Na+/H+ antiporter NhaB
VWPPTLAKLAILVLYFRLIPNPGFRLGIYAVAAGLVIYTLVFTILLAWPCHPLKPGTTTCVVNLTISQGVLNIVSDAIVIALPIPLIHRLNMPLRQRITAGLLLALGSA